jgi:hypothetical protein
MTAGHLVFVVHTLLILLGSRARKPGAALFRRVEQPA